MNYDAKALASITNVDGEITAAEMAIHIVHQLPGCTFPEAFIARVCSMCDDEDAVSWTRGAHTLQVFACKDDTGTQFVTCNIIASE